MNFQGKAVLVYLEEDNIPRAYFRVQPLMTQDGPLGPVIGDFPDEGFLRIVPDKNEQHTFKERMRNLLGLCLVDLRLFPLDANKIRTNKNYAPIRGESNQFIVYSDAVRSLPEDLVYQVVSESDVKSAMTPFVYIRNGANIQGPFRRDSGESVGETSQLPPDSNEIHEADVNGQHALFYWPKAAEPAAPAKPVAVPAPAPAEIPAAPAPVEAPAPKAAEPAAEEKKPEAPAKPEEAAPAPEKTAMEQIQSLNAPVSENANRLRAPAAPTPVDFIAEQPARPLAGTKLYQAPPRPVPPRRAHNPLMEAVENQRYASRFDNRYETRYEAPGATLPQNAELKEVHNPAEALKRALQGMSHSPETQRQAADVILAQSGMRAMLSKSLAHEANDLTLAAMQSQLQELEAERLMTLMQLDDVKKNLSAAHEEALGKLNMAEQKKLDQLHIAQQKAQNELDKLNKAMEPLEAKRQEIARAIQEGQSILDNRYDFLCAPVGKDVSREELIERVEKTMKAAGFVMEEGDALALLTALALTKDTFAFRAEIEADAEAALAALAHALGAPLVESNWSDRLVMLSGGNAPVLVQFNDMRHPLVWKVAVNGLSDWDLEGDRRFPYASVPVAVREDALLEALPDYGPVTKDCVLKAFLKEGALNNDTKAALSVLRKGLKDTGAPLPVAAVDMLCRFIAATQNDLKGGVAEAMDRAALLIVVPHLLDNKVDPDSVRNLFAATPRTLKALKA